MPALAADLGLTGLLAVLDLPDLRRRQKRAVGVQVFSQSAHRTAHHAVEVWLLDVVAHDERDDILEDPQVRVRVIAARHHVAEEAPDDGKRNHRSRDKKDQQSGS
jgi:hypothetical protein